ncbi:MAG: N-acetylmuramoyl-L-alanine amidase-like domain-containing protein [Bacteroidota bacterium]
MKRSRFPYLLALLSTWMFACQSNVPAQSESATAPLETAAAEIPVIPTTCTAQNKATLEGHLVGLAEQSWGEVPIGAVAIAVGKRFLGVPYVAKTLDLPGDEQLVIEQQGLDCTTFLENSVVLARLAKQDRLTFADFQQELAYIRYRDGALAGYPSRIHYFSEWITHSSARGIIDDMTQAIGGVPYELTLDFMSTHRTAYAQLAEDDEALAAITATEAALNQRTNLFYLPQEKVAAQEHLIQDGDLIAITTSVKGLDIAHVGLAIHQNGRLHLFHASTTGKQVLISEKPLADYLAGIKRHTGIMVGRLKE